MVFARCPFCEVHSPCVCSLSKNPISNQSLSLWPVSILIHRFTDIHYRFLFPATSMKHFNLCTRPISVRFNISLAAVAVAEWVPASVCSGKISSLILLVDFGAVDHIASARASSYLTASSHLECTDIMGRHSQKAYRVWFEYSVVFLARNAKDERKCTFCSIALKDPQISPKASVSTMLRIRRRSRSRTPMSPTL